jgi:cell division protein FtsA
VRKGIIVDVQATAEAIGTSLRRAEQQSGFKAISAFVGIAGAHIESTNNHAIVAVRHPDSVVSTDDVARVIDGARIIQLPSDQEILHVIPHHYVVDGMDGIKDPVGMVGHRLEVEANIVTGSTTSIHNLVRCVESVDVELDGLVLEPLAAGQAVLSENERELGAIVIDMGGGTTDTAVFRDGSVVHACVLPVGGHQISNDLAFGLRASLAAAEELKIRYGSTISHARPEGETVPISGYGQEDNPVVEQRTVAEIIDARLAETFELVQAQVARAGFGEDYAASVVLTGGSAQIPGAAALASDVFGVPARLGTPLGVQGLADAVRSPAFSTSVGLLAWGREQLAPRDDWPGSGRLQHVGDTLRSWLRNFFP